MVEIRRLNPNQNVKIYAKLEDSILRSVKDRIAKYMEEKAEVADILTKDRTLLEPTSAKIGISIRMIAKEYKDKRPDAVML